MSNTELSEFFSLVSKEKSENLEKLKTKINNPESDLANLFERLENAHKETTKVSEEISVEKILTEEDQNRLEVFSNLMTSFDSVKEIPEEVKIVHDVDNIVHDVELKEIEEPEEIIPEEIVKTDNIISDIVNALDEMGEKTEVKEEIDQISALRRDFDNFRNLIQRDISNQKMSGAGSGEVRLEFLDDIQRSTAKVDGKFLKYSSSDSKWIGADASGGGSSAADDISAGDAAVNITTTSGNITIDAAANNTDIIFKGTDATADITMLTLDGSAAGAATFNSTVTTTGLTIGSTAVTSTAAELNILDGVTSTAAELNILDGVTSTAAELNLIDGGTSRGTTAVASGDGILINDAGTMAMTNVDTVSTYFASHSVGGGNIVTTGALDTGSITSGFGTIDTGASAITTTGLISGGSLDIDNVLINGTTIGHTDDTDLMTVADGVLTVAGELDAATLDISGNADIDGTLEADAYTVDGTTLAEYIADTAGAMVSSNTETGVTVTYQDGDNTIDFAVDAAQTTITSIYATDLIMGEDSQTAIDFGTANEIDFKVDNAARLTLTSGALYPVTDNQIDLGTSSLEFKDAFFDGTVTSDAFAGPLTGDVTGTSSKATVSDSTANTNFPVVFHDESNALLDDTGALRYNPSTGTLLVPNLSVAGTTTTVDTVTMEAANAVIFEGATADGNETTLSIVDPTGDHTQYLINQGGYIPLLAAATTTAITSTPAELNLLDGSSANSVVNSKAVIYGSSGELAGTLSTAAQANVTSLGTLTALTVDDVAVNGKVITMTGSSSDTAVFTAGTNGTLSIVTTDAAAAAANIQITADGTFEVDATTVTLDSAGDIILDADGADVIFKDAGTAILTFTNSSSDAVITSGVQDKDIIFKGDDGGSPITALTLDMSAAGNAIFNNDIYVDKIRRASDSGTTTKILLNDEVLKLYAGHSSNEVVNIASGAVAITGSVTASGILKTDDTTEATSTTDGSLQTDGGLSIAKDAVFGDDVKLLSDAAVISFGANSEVTVTHVHDTGLLLNSTMQLQFNDASQYINAPSATVLDINATDEIELNATLADVNANLDVSGTYTGGGLMTTGGNIVIPNAGNIGSASDTDAIAIASNGVVTFSQVPVLPNDTIETADVQDNAVTLAKMAGLARGKIIYGDSSGDPAALAVGSANYVLTSDGTDVAWAEASGGSVTAINNATANELVTIGSTTTELDAESSLTFDGTTLALAGAIAVSPDAGEHAVFNEGSIDADFRVESNGNANMLFVDGGNDRVGIGTASPGTLFHSYTTSNDGTLKHEATGGNAMIDIVGNRTSDADIGHLRFHNAGTAVLGQVRVERAGANNTGVMKLQVNNAGSITDIATLSTTSLTTPILNLGDEDMEHYDEGTWTPSLTTEGGSIAAYTLREGVYVRIGEWVNCTGTIDVQTVSSPSGSVSMTGIPFTLPDNDGNQGAFTVNLNGWSGLGTASIHGTQTKNATTALVGKAGASGSINDIGGDLQNGCGMHFTISFSLA